MATQILTFYLYYLTQKDLAGPKSFGTSQNLGQVTPKNRIEDKRTPDGVGGQGQQPESSLPVPRGRVPPAMPGVWGQTTEAGARENSLTPGHHLSVRTI